MERTRRLSRGGESKSSGVFRGEEGMRRSEQERELQQKRAEERRNRPFAPFRFRVPVGKTNQAIVLDEKPDFFRYEHNMKDSQGHWSIFTSCPKETENCPVCEKTQRESYYAMYLTVIDLTPYTTGKGERVEFSRKLLVVKPAQHKKFIRMWKKEGNIRGALLDFTRDGDKEPAIGNDIDLVEFVEEDELSRYTRRFKDGEGKSQTEDCSQPFDYAELFPVQTTAELRGIVGGEPPPGSREADERALGSRRRGTSRGNENEETDNWTDENGDDVPWGKDGDKPSGSTSRVSPRRAAPEEEQDEPAPVRRRRAAPEDNDTETEPAPRRRPRAAEPEAEPASRPRRARVVEEEPEGEETARGAGDAEGHDDDPPRGTVRRPLRRR